MISSNLEVESDTYLVQLRRMIGEPCPPGLGLVQAEVVDGWRWRPAEDGRLMLTVGEFEGEELIDIAAFRMSNPEEVYLRTGEAFWLGLDNFRAARFSQTPLLVNSRIDRYIRAGGKGVLPLDGDFERLLDVPELVFDDADFKRVVMGTLERRPKHLPRFRVQRAAA